MQKDYRSPHSWFRPIKIKTPASTPKSSEYHDRARRQDCDKARSGRHIHKGTIEMEMDQRGLAIARNRIDKNQPKSLKKNKSDQALRKAKVEILKAMLVEEQSMCGINMRLTV
jgi:hypothetical protein